MRKNLLFLAVFISSLMVAAPVDENEAQQRASRFMSAKTGIQKKLTVASCGVRRAGDTKQAPLYVFNIDGGGYIVVSGDSRTEEILAYSTTGSFDASQIPDNMKALLQEYADGIESLMRHDVQVLPGIKTAGRRAPGESIAPILQRHWDQNDPYNRQCPYISGQRTVTGCVATAMAQVMGHFNWPAATTKEIPAYVSQTRNISIGAIEAGTSIDWENIIDSYKGYYTSTQAAAVAKLMKLCGSAVKMDYDLANAGGSKANGAVAVKALVKYFDYEEESCRYLSRSEYSYDEWKELIYKELRENRPVLYSGQSTDAGHMFIVDGYRDDDFFHVNWGWGGMSDDYVRLRLLCPADQGVGGGDSEMGYTIGQGIGVGIKPNDGVVKEMPVAISLFNIELGKTTFSRTSETQDFNLGTSIKYSILNDEGEDVTVDIGAYIVNEKGEVLNVLKLQEKRLLQSGYSYTYPYSSFPKFGAGYADGSYQIVFVSRKSGTTDWNICRNSGKYAVVFDIAGNQLTIKEPDYHLTVTNVEIIGNKQAGSDQTVRVTVLNNGSICRSDVYAYINPYNPNSFSSNVEKVIPAAFIDLGKGESTTFEFKFKPTKSGLNKIYLVCDQLRIFGNAIEVSITGGIDLKCISSEMTSGKLHHADLNYIYGNTATFDIKIGNDGEKDFRGYVYLKLIGKRSFTSYLLNSTSVLKNGTITSNGSTTVSYQFDASSWKNDYGITRFYFSLYYRESDQTQEIKLADLDEFEVREIPFKLIIKDPQIEHSNATDGTVEGNVFQLSSVLQNMGEVTFNAPISIRVWEFLPSTDTWTYTEDAVAFELPAGDSKQFNYSFTNPAKEEGTKYYLETFFTYDEEKIPLYMTGVYSFVGGSNGIEELTGKSKHLSNKVFDMHGRQVGGTSGFNQMKSGVYIVGGKKMVKR